MESACIGIGHVSASSLADVWFHAQMDVHVVVVSKLVKESLDRAALITNVVLVFHPGMKLVFVICQLVFRQLSSTLITSDYFVIHVDVFL